jgi:AcrR family transcriptional regulator
MLLGKSNGIRRTVATVSRIEQRRADARRAILEAAWTVADARGWDFSLSDLGSAVGMRAPSLYSYFGSRAEILDAMFADGYRAMDRAIDEVRAALPPELGEREQLITLLDAWLGFCCGNLPRYQLLFTAAIPGWHPSEEAYAVSVASYARMAEYLGPLGIQPGPRLDLFTAVMSGLAAQQVANDPGGTRWAALVPDVVDMFLPTTARQPQEAR